MDVTNELSSNLQEITLLYQNLCESGQAFTTQASSLLNETDIDAESITLLKEKVVRFESEMDMLTEVIDYFNFYTVERSDDD